jgi:putative flavoprotein involved in K+ transport
VNAATPFGLLPLRGAEQLAAANAMDRKLLDSLISAGFELSQGPNGQGVLGLIYGQNATGYYFNAGASELIVDGTIKLRRGNVTGFTSTGVALADGSTMDADLVIFATGYRGPTSAIREVLGDDAADHLGEFAKVGEGHEFGRLWRRSGLDRLWFMISLGLAGGRFYSKLLALQIAGVEAGSASAGQPSTCSTSPSLRPASAVSGRSSSAPSCPLPARARARIDQMVSAGHSWWRTRARWTASRRPPAPSLRYNARWWVFTVVTDT